MKRIAVLLFLAALACAAIGLIGASQFGMRGVSGQEVVPTVTTDKLEYAPGDTVKINGSGFEAFCALTIRITRPDAAVDSAAVAVAADGSFLYEYALDGIEGYYVVDVVDGAGTVLATTFFWDAIGKSLDQCANGPLTGIFDPCRWQGGDLNSSNSHYAEGRSIPYRATLEKVPQGTSHYIRITYDFTAGGVMAFDFLTTYNRTESPDPCADLPAGAYCPASSGTIDIPSDTFNVPPPVSTYELPQEERTFTIFGGTLTSVSATITHSGPLGGNSSAQMDVYFTADASCPNGECTVLILWGGHLARAVDWGAGQGAGSISGAPFHMAYQVDGGGGKPDRSIQPGSIPSEGTIRVCKDVSPDDASVWDFTLTGPSPGSTSGLGDNQCFDFPSRVAGSYTLSEATQAGYSTSVSCDNNASGTNSVNFSLSAEQTVTCTFINTPSEVCDGVDNDGDTLVDEGFPDTDGDGIADCMDTETCDGVDNDGDTLVDEGFPDTDGDGIADCMDTEECDGVDNDGDTPVTLRKVLHNNGPYTGSVEVTIAKTATAPADCSISPSRHSEQVVLPFSVDVPVDESFTIHCTSPSTHTFSVANVVSGPKDPNIVDPDLTNNTAHTDLTVDAIGYADLKVMNQYFENPPAQIAASQNVTVTLDKVLHNNGPYGPVNAQTTTTVAVPTGCTASPNPHTQQFYAVPVSVDVLHHEPFVIHCTVLGRHTFTFDDVVGQPKDPHILDPDETNNDWTTDLTVTAVAAADIKVISAAFVNLPLSIPKNTNVDITLHKVIHNNGPKGGVDIAINGTASAPTGCTVVFKSGPTSLINVPVSVDQPVDEVWTIRCTSDGALRTFVFNGSIAISTPNVVDPNTANNSVRKLLTVRDPAYPYWGDDICDGRDNDGDTAIDEGWNLAGSAAADCLDPALDTDGDGRTNDVDTDDDGDRWTDAKEGIIGTNPLGDCALDVYDDAWPPDINNNREVNILDVALFRTPLNGTYDRRYDLRGDGNVDILDVVMYRSVLGASCTSSSPHA